MTKNIVILLVICSKHSAHFSTLQQNPWLGGKQVRKKQYKLKIYLRLEIIHWHRRTGQEILGGGGVKLVCPTSCIAANVLGGSGASSPRKILKCRVSQMPFPAF